MFNTHFGFTATPFAKSLAINDVLLTSGVKELHARLQHAVRERGIALVTGDIGSGKSTAVRAFLATLDTNRNLIIPIAAPIASPAALYRTLLLALNERPPFGAAAQLAALRAVLNDAINNRRIPVIVLDEAHLLDPTIIDPLRILLASQLDSLSLASLILIGQSDLRRTLQLNALQAFAQRITVRACLDPLGLEAALGYISHHLNIAGADASVLLAQDALQRIADFAQGNPRRINQIVTAALLAAAADKKRIVDDTAVRRAINDLEHD